MDFFSRVRSLHRLSGRLVHVLLGDDVLAARCLMLNSYLIDRFLRTFNDQYRRREVVDQCSLEGTASELNRVVIWEFLHDNIECRLYLAGSFKVTNQIFLNK